MKLRLLPLLVLVALMVFAIRFGETLTSVKDFDAQALAETKPAEDKKADDKKADHKEPDKKEPAPKAESDPKTKETPDQKPTDEKPSDSIDAATEKPVLSLPEVWSSPTDEAMDTSVERENLLRDLAKRREMLEKREAELVQREAVLSAAQKQIDAKMAEMDKLKAQLETLLGKQSEDDAAQTKSLVKIYEGMKPKDAAAIFDELDIDLLVMIVSHMSETRASPVLALMEPAKARDVTMRLSEMKKIPTGQKPVTSPPLNQDLGQPAYVPGIDDAIKP